MVTQELEIDMSVLSSFPAVRMDDFCGPWFVHAERLQAQIEILRAMDLRAHMMKGAEIAPMDYTMTTDGIAVVGISGLMTKRGSSFSNSGSTIRARQALRNAEMNDSVRGIMLHIESPGGTVAGTKELADAFSSLEKPTAAFFSDIGASAAYYVGSQADHVSANSPAIIGSIGTYLAIYDYSEFFEKGGIKVHLITTGEHKGAGVKGTKLTESQLAEDQLIVNESNELFLEAVALGRGLTRNQIESVSTGQVWLAGNAAEIGLIDAVYSFDEAMAAFSQRIEESMSKERSKTMSAEKAVETSTADNLSPTAEVADAQAVEPVAAEVTVAEPVAAIEQVVVNEPVVNNSATLADLEAACPGAPADFLLAQLKANATAQQASSAFILHLQESQSKSKSVSGPVGVAPIGTTSNSSESSGSAIEEWRSALKKKMDNGIDRQRAVVLLQRENPELHASYMEEYSLAYPTQS